MERLYSIRRSPARLSAIRRVFSGVTRGYAALTPGCDVAPIQGAGGMRHCVARRFLWGTLASLFTIRYSLFPGASWGAPLLMITSPRIAVFVAILIVFVHDVLKHMVLRHGFEHFKISDDGFPDILDIAEPVCALAHL